MRILVLGGTWEGRTLSEQLAQAGHQVVLSVATEYGKMLACAQPGLEVQEGRMDAGQMAQLIEAQRCQAVIDATHPYAQLVTCHAKEAAAAQKVPYFRLVREETPVPQSQQVKQMDSLEQAAEYLSGCQGNILLTTGSKDLVRWSSVEGFSKRCWARVLPTVESLESCRLAGLPSSHIIAMQGPFSQQLNEAMLRQINGKFLVTKQSGKPGGMEEKWLAAVHAQAQLVVIGRPCREEGFSREQLLEQFGVRQSNGQ